ncbi:MAG: hypothetical protein MZV64_35100 [Ignavibacteriales bacterium]|nr:hypothetical protein [Ignavibacteriales bacterium]
MVRREGLAQACRSRTLPPCRRSGRPGACCGSRTPRAPSPAIRHAVAGR